MAAFVTRRIELVDEEEPTEHQVILIRLTIARIAYASQTVEEIPVIVSDAYVRLVGLLTGLIPE